METALDSVPEDMEALRAAFLAMRSKAAALEIENARLAAEVTYLDTLNQKLAHHLAKLKRLKFGPSSERLNPDQLQLALEDLEQKIAELFGADPSESQGVVVVGVPDRIKGEALVVLTTFELSAWEVREKLLAEGLPNLWIPRVVRRVDTIPVLSTGKLDLAECRRLASEVYDP